MNRVHRQRILAAVDNLPDEALLELTGFIDYLQYKFHHPDPIRESHELLYRAIAHVEMPHPEVEDDGEPAVLPLPH